MFRPVLRSATSSFRALPRSVPSRRFVSTGTQRRSGGLRSFVARWGLAGAAVYYYNTSSVFAEEPTYTVHSPPEVSRESETYATIDSLAEQRRAQARSHIAPASSSPTTTETIAVPDAEPAAAGSPDELEEEASQQGAFNEETGEINWDCPCLGGMAHGPCGDEFKAAFSCFVYSKEEPKGVDCIEHFKTMQSCFREHPDVYGAELEDTEGPPPQDLLEGEPTSVNQEGAAQNNGEKLAHSRPGEPDSKSEIAGKHERAEAATQQVERDHGITSESDEAVPKAWHDSRSDNTAK